MSGKVCRCALKHNNIIETYIASLCFILLHSYLIWHITIFLMVSCKLMNQNLPCWNKLEVLGNSFQTSETPAYFRCWPERVNACFQRSLMYLLMVSFHRNYLAFWSSLSSFCVLVNSIEFSSSLHCFILIAVNPSSYKWFFFQKLICELVIWNLEGTFQWKNKNKKILGVFPE